MTVSTHAKYALALSILQTATADIGSPQNTMSKNYSADLTNGTGTNQANEVWADNRTLSGSANEDIDLSGVLTDAFGNTLALTKVKAIFIVPTSGAGTISLKPAASNGFTGPFGAAAHTVSVPLGGMIALTAPGAGWTVTAGTGDKINVANTDAAGATYDIIVIGTV